MFETISVRQYFRQDYNGRPFAIKLKERDMVVKTHPYYSNGKFYGRMYDFQNTSTDEVDFFLRCKDNIDIIVQDDIELIIKKLKEKKSFETNYLKFEKTSFEVLEQKSQKEKQQLQNQPFSLPKSLQEIVLCNIEDDNYRFLDNDTSVEGVVEFGEDVYEITKKEFESYQPKPICKKENDIVEQVYNHLEQKNIKINVIFSIGLLY
jgi:hypothetical protein